MLVWNVSDRFTLRTVGLHMNYLYGQATPFFQVSFSLYLFSMKVEFLISLDA